jgi:Fe-S cluster assembly protein SufD
MSALLDSMAQAFCGSDARREVLDAALRDGLPAARNEAWKYTSLRQLERRAFAAAPLRPGAGRRAAGRHPGAAPGVRQRPPGCRAERCAGLPSGVQPLSAALAAGEDAVRFLGRRYERSEEIFARLNAALADEGVVLRVDEGVQVEAPLQLVFASVAGEADLAWHHRHLIELRAGASLGVVEHRFSVGDSAHLDNTVLHAHVARDGVLKHARVQAGSARQTSFLRTDAVLARDAQYHRVDLELGAALSRHELNVRLEGDNAQLTANGVLLGNGRRHVETRLGIDHIARDTAASCCGAASPPTAAAWCSMVASRSAKAPTAPTRTCPTRTCCCRPMPRSTPSRRW